MNAVQPRPMNRRSPLSFATGRAFGRRNGFGPRNRERVAGGWVEVPRRRSTASRPSRCRALTLVEMMGVLAIVALVATLFFGMTLAYCNRHAREAELRSLHVLGEGLRLSVTSDLRIPCQTNFAVQISRYSGQSLGSILTNAVGNPRLLVIDPGVTNSGWDLPFDQTANPMSGAGGGTPRNLRMLLISSVAGPLPAGLPVPPGGKVTSTLFSNLWAAPVGTLPAGLAWSGDPHDLFIQRVQFLDLFYPVSLNHAEFTGVHTNGRVRWPGMTGFAAPTGAPFPWTRWYLKGTSLILSNAADHSTLSEIVTDPVSFTYEKGFWLRSMNDLTKSSVELSPITGADFERAVSAFLAGSTHSHGHNPGAFDTAQQVVSAMSNYVLWGAQGPNSTTKQKMDQQQSAMESALLDYTDLPPGQFNKP